MKRRFDEKGVALVVVMLSVFALMSLGLAFTSYAVGSQNLSKRDERWNAAIPAAEAGVDDYILRLNENSNYWQYSSSNPPPDGNQAFSQFVDVPGSANDSTYKYSADTSQLGVDGTVALTSTGRVGGVERSIQTILRRRSFIDYLYFTDFETLDPAMYTGNPFTPAQAQVQCAKYYYAGRNSNCTEITFISADAINGPMHTNDAFRVCGSPDFNGETSTSWSGTGNPVKRWRDVCPTSNPFFANAGDPRQLPPLTMPPSNSSLKAETEAGVGGCLFTGPTKIILNSNGTMTVTSPFSKQTNGGCPTNTTGSLPANGVIYVQNVPSISSDPNYTAGCPYNVSGENHPLGLPIDNDITNYQCRVGDVFIEGTLNGQLTVAAENNIDITWNLQYQGGIGGDDLLGLVANNYVEIYHPVRCTSTSSTCNLAYHSGSRFQNPVIQAAILSVNHSFRVQNWAYGAPLGTINLTGAFAQRYRGPVGTFSGGTIVSGYAKNYVYDQRLKYLEPPKFLDPVASAWGIATYSEVPNP